MRKLDDVTSRIDYSFLGPGDLGSGGRSWLVNEAKRGIRVACLKVLKDSVSWRFKHRVQITYKCFICCSVLETEEQGQPDLIQPLPRYRRILFQRPRASISLAKMVVERDTLIL